MQQQAAQAYQQVARGTTNPRELEANLLSKSATNLHRIREDWESGKADLNNALLYNRKIWTVLLTTVTKEENPLPDAIRENVANLGLFVLRHTVAIQARPEPEKLDTLININRELAQGLRAQATEE